MSKHITKIVVASGIYVDSIQLYYNYGIGRSGGKGGALHTVLLDSDEVIVKVFGRKGIIIDAIGFITNKSKAYGPFGGQGGTYFEFTGSHMIGMVIETDHMKLNFLKRILVVKSVEPLWGSDNIETSPQVKTLPTVPRQLSMRLEDKLICQKPILFISVNDDANRPVFTVNQEAMEIIGMIDQEVRIVGIVGQETRAKSVVMHKLIGQNCTDNGPLSQSPGIWVWGKKLQGNTTLIVLESTGLNSIENDKKSRQLFILSLLISSVLVNITNDLTSELLHSLGLVIQIAELTLHGAIDDDDTCEVNIGKYMPHLSLLLNNNPPHLEANTFLDQQLEPVLDATNLNKSRSLIKQSFKSIRLLYMPQSDIVGEELQVKLDTLVRSIMDRADVKTNNQNLNDVKSTGNALIEVVKKYVGMINSSNNIHVDKRIRSQCRALCSSLDSLDLSDHELAISMDKLLLLSETFDEARTYYTVSRLTVSAKFNTIIENAKTALYMNSFDEYSAELTRLSAEISILEYHIDSGLLKKTYQDLVASFSTHIHDKLMSGISVLVENPKETILQLKQNDAIMVAMHESSSLCSHVDIEYISSIHEQYCKIVQVQYNLYLDKIKKVFSYGKLGSALIESGALMEQATILMNLQSITLRVTKSYYEIIDFLCAQVLAVRSSFEQELDKLLGFSNFTAVKSVPANYQKLENQLMVTKNAEWLDLYRPGVYSSLVFDIEKMFMDHLLEIQEMMDNTSFDLGNSNNMSQTSKFIEHCKKKIVMELLDTMPNAADAWKKMETCFIDRIRGNLEKIEVSIQADKEKSFNSFHPQSVERQSSYIQTCLSSALLRSISHKTQALFVQFLKAYALFVENSIEDSYNRIISQQEEKDGDMFDCVAVLSNRLNQVVLISKNHPMIFEHFNQNIMDYMANKFLKQWMKLSMELNTGSQSGLNSNLKVSQYLVVVDKYFDHSFESLYNQYQDKVHKQTETVQNDTLELLKSHNYMKIAKIMDQLKNVGDEQSLNTLQNIQQAALEALSSFINETRSKIIPVQDSIESFLELVTDSVGRFIMINDTRKLLHQHIDTQCLQQEYETIIKTIELKIESYVDLVEELIRSTDFEEADRQHKVMRSINILIGSYCSDSTSKSILKLEQSITNAMKNTIDEYIMMDVGQYRLKPPQEIIEKLYSMKRIPVAQKIEEGIHIRFRKEIKNAFESQNAVANLKKLEGISKSTLTQKLHDDISVEIASALEEIDNLKNYADNVIQSAINNDDLKTITEYLGDKSKRGHMSEQSIIEPLLQKLRERRTEIMNILGKKMEGNYGQMTDPRMEEIDADIKKVWVLFRIIFDYVQAFGKTITEINTIFGDIKNQLFQLKTLLYNRVGKLTIASEYMTDSVMVDAERSFNTLNTLMLLIKTHPEAQSVIFGKEALGEDFVAGMNNLHQKLWNQLLSFQNQFDQGLNIKDMTIIKGVLNQMKVWTGIQSKISDQCQKPNEGVPSTYSEMVKSVIRFIMDVKDEIVAVELMNDETKRSEKSRNAFFIQVQCKMVVLKIAKDLTSHIESTDIMDVEIQGMDALRKQGEFLFSQAQKLLDQQRQLRRDEYDILNNVYNNMIAFKKYATSAFQIDCGETQVRDKMYTRIDQVLRELDANITQPEVVANKLIELQLMGDSVIALREDTSMHIEHSLSNFRLKNDGGNSIAKLGVLLNRDTDGIGQIIIAERACFKGYSVSLFNSRTKHQDIDYVMKKLEGEGIGIDLQKLRSRYDEFINNYTSFVERYLDPKNEKLNELISNLKQEVHKLPTTGQEWNITIKDSIPTLMAYIFALWTLMNSQHYFGASGTENKESYLLKPHAAQVVSIFRILGVGDIEHDSNSILSWFRFGKKHQQPKNRIINNLVQIGTGEGKSVTLAVTASVLSLLGYDVMCACYSDYLSQRDYRDFSPIFDVLGITEYISYGTFNKLCEKVVNAEGNVRELVEKCVQNKINSAQPKENVQRSKALLIDEVDVFFNKSFYGNEYVPMSSLRDQTVVALINMIWANQQKWKQIKSKRALQEIKESHVYMACCQVYSGWEFLIEEGIKDMLADLNTFESHDYLVQNDRIGYKEQDGISFKITFGYKTMFAYFFEHSKGKISQASLQKNICIGVSCGEFSYAEVPLEFDCIMGVTGTLKTLSDTEKDIVRDRYKIVKSTFAPSVFGENTLVFSRDRDIRIENEDDYMTALANEIESRIQGMTQGTKRAVLVFFETRQRLNEFYASKVFAIHKDQTMLIIEELSSIEKESAIKRATTFGQITLLTRVFGRGTDFVCRDQIVSANGGAHVIQTFLSEELSEETQIKGRTARQGDAGSYSMVLMDKDLEKFSIFDEDVKLMRDKGSYYPTLDAKRKEYFKLQYFTNHNHVTVLEQKHADTQQFVKAILANEQDNVKEFLKQHNMGTPVDNLSRTIVLMDATGSMSHLLNNAKKTVGVMFDRAADVLTSNGIEANMFELQFAVYRNYNAPEDALLQYSPWESKPSNLRSFMETISPSYGQGNEAIEIGLCHANQEAKIGDVSQVILIGDAPANTYNEVDYRRSQRGESYWSRTRFSTPTYLDRELVQLREKNIKVHAFYVANYAKSSFELIATSTGGRCEYLDIGSSESAQLLTNVVTEEVLRNIGGALKGNILVEAYRKRYIA